MKHRAQIKQLQIELKSRKVEVARAQLEDESLIIEPGKAYNKVRSHRLDVYNEDAPSSSSKRRKVGRRIKYMCRLNP